MFILVGSKHMLLLHSNEVHDECSPDYVSLQFSHYHFISKNIFHIVLYHILFNTFTADLL